MTEVCRIFQKFGKLTEPYELPDPKDVPKEGDKPKGIRAMLEIIKVPNWHNIPPFEFYLTPL